MSFIDGNERRIIVDSLAFQVLAALLLGIYEVSDSISIPTFTPFQPQLSRGERERLNLRRAVKINRVANECLPIHDAD